MSKLIPRELRCSLLHSVACPLTLACSRQSSVDTDGSACPGDRQQTFYNDDSLQLTEWLLTVSIFAAHATHFTLVTSRVIFFDAFVENLSFPLLCLFETMRSIIIVMVFIRSLYLAADKLWGLINILVLALHCYLLFSKGKTYSSSPWIYIRLLYQHLFYQSYFWINYINDIIHIIAFPGYPFKKNIHCNKRTSIWPNVRHCSNIFSCYCNLSLHIRDATLVHPG